MADTKSMSKIISNFSKKFSQFNKSENREIVRQKNPDRILQEKITASENERKLKLQKDFSAYLNPVTQDIESDEESLLKAYELYRQIFEVTQKFSDGKTHLADIKITSPICTKSEYTQKNKFSFLRLWFLQKNTDADFVPVIICENAKFYLSFVKKEEFEFSGFEKEIMQALS
ncbi:MAG: hypothetical protein ACI4LX_06825 [Treponema sp.]